MENGTELDFRRNRRKAKIPENCRKRRAKRDLMQKCEEKKIQIEMQILLRSLDDTRKKGRSDYDPNSKLNVEESK